MNEKTIDALIVKYEAEIEKAEGFFFKQEQADGRIYAFEMVLKDLKKLKSESK